MDTHQLKIFCAVAESGNLVGAATKLHLTKSAISHSIKSLEAHLGCRLFEREARKMALNQAGEQLLSAVVGPLASLESAMESIKRPGKSGQTRLRVGAPASICQHLLPPVIRELKKAHAHLELLLETDDTPDLVQRLNRKEIDLAIGIAPDTQLTLQMRPLFRDELMFVFPSTHAWAAGRPISSEELRAQSLILYSRSSFSARILQAFLKKVSLVPNAALEIGNLEAIKTMVKHNLGVAVLAPWVVKDDLAEDSLCLRPVSVKPLTRQWVMLCLPGRHLNLAEEEFFKLCRRHATALRHDRRDVPAPKSGSMEAAVFTG